jgi:hypothetical protein
VLSHFPSIDTYNDVAGPHDWEALAAAQAHTNPRIFERIGDLSLVPPERRLSGPGACPLQRIQARPSEMLATVLDAATTPGLGEPLVDLQALDQGLCPGLPWDRWCAARP